MVECSWDLTDAWLVDVCSLEYGLSGVMAHSGSLQMFISYLSNQLSVQNYHLNGGEVSHGRVLVVAHEKIFIWNFMIIDNVPELTSEPNMNMWV